MVLLEVFRTGVTAVELYEVAAAVIVGQTHREALLFVRQSGEQAAVVGIQIAAEVEHNQTAYTV